MKKYNFKKVSYYFIMTLLIGVYSCSVNDDYKKFVEEGELSYTGKIDSLKILPGRNRVKLEGLIISDPKVTQLRVYWNSKKDSAIVPITRTSGVDAVSTVIENLPENIYNFEVKTFDAKGNGSIAQNVTASTYGPRYQASLTNRNMINNIPDGDRLTINFADMDRSSGVLGSEIVYTTSNGLEKTIFVDINDSNVVIPDSKFLAPLKYRTTFKPTTTAIDIFYTDYTTVQPRPTPALKNAKQPFAYDTVAGLVGGRWGTLAEPWITNAAAKTHNGVGGYDNGCCAGREKTMNLESGWGSPNYTNAKIHQVTTADANVNYQLRFTTVTSNYSTNDAAGAYLVIALGANGLPNVENVTTAPEVIAYKKIGGIDGGTLTVNFSVPQVSQISVGLVATQTGEKYCNIKSWEIIKL
ncbi:DUF4998 domain-containing protein [Flavobacterium eburneipallidum]|uniref:DUF4998 domain-containing protein n=1 Tax=Flavobacterium eburneipallidum TaxID=3003263 RepID=UPI0024821F0B|nr:DUF4998 domain-containing protein [Flavobacterium eburneipallidum]